MNDDPVPEHRPPSSEEEAIATIADAMAIHGMTPDLSDDCALVTPTARLISTDTIVEGRHFDCTRDTMEQIGRQAAVSSLSDLAASGGTPTWLVWSLCLPAHWTTEDLHELSNGFSAVAALAGGHIVGGNLSRIEGPAVINVTVAGSLAADTPFLRSGARPGDIVYLSGAIGDSILGVLETDATARHARHAWRPHISEAQQLAEWGKVTAAMEVSDGLLKDAGRLAAASGLAVDICSDAIPVSELYRLRCKGDPTLAMRGGEDYVLLFTASPNDTVPLTAYPVGECLAGEGVYVDGVLSSESGFDHFQEGIAR
jgi:thiamine-monophosphate kinase